MEGSSLVGMARGSNGRNGGTFGKTPWWKALGDVVCAGNVVQSGGGNGGVTHHVACAQLCIPPCVQCQRRGNGIAGVIHAAATSARTGVTCRRALDAFAGGSGGGGDRAKAGSDGGGDRAKAGCSLS